MSNQEAVKKAEEPEYDNIMEWWEDQHGVDAAGALMIATETLLNFNPELKEISSRALVERPDGGVIIIFDPEYLEEVKLVLDAMDEEMEEDGI